MSLIAIVNAINQHEIEQELALEADETKSAIPYVELNITPSAKDQIDGNIPTGVYIINGSNPLEYKIDTIILINQPWYTDLNEAITEIYHPRKNGNEIENPVLFFRSHEYFAVFSDEVTTQPISEYTKKIKEYQEEYGLEKMREKYFPSNSDA